MLKAEDCMKSEKLMAIKELMDELVGEMEPSSEDFDVRLGKPKVEVMKLESEEPMEGDMLAMDGDSDPDEQLKERIMKLRG